MPKYLLPTLLFALVFPFSLAAAPPPPPAAFINAASAIIYDMDNEAILFEQNADQPIPPASLTKVMSLFLALDHIKQGHSSKNTLVRPSREAVNAGGSSMGLRSGEEVELGKLLLGMAVSSGNDASHAVAEHVGGSVDAFVKMMNNRAKTLGMNDSHFSNPHGLPHPTQFTTARDMLSLARAYLRAHPQALDLHNTKILEHKGYTSWNKNPLLGQYPGADGLKTGWIRASGHNLIFTASRDGRRLLGVILGAPDAWVRGAEACRLLDAGFQVCQNASPTLTAALDTIPLDTSRIDARKTARDAGLLKPRPVNKRLLGAKRLLAQKSLTKRKLATRKGKASAVAAKKAKGRLSAKKARSKPAKSQGAAKAHAQKSSKRSARRS